MKLHLEFDGILATDMNDSSIFSFVRLTIVGIILLAPLACASPELSTDQAICLEPDETQVLNTSELSVLTLNLAHGRKDSLNQMLQKTSTTRKNLEEIAGFLDDSGADLIALQEADSASRWSGKFDHVEFLSKNSSYSCRVHANHASKYMYNFGTALISKVAFTDTLSHTFAPSPPTTDKGFVMGQVRWNPGGQLAEPIIVSVISVHLDFSRKSVRESQVKEMQELLPDMTTPTIILGDFNADWGSNNSALRNIVSNSNFKVFEPESADLGTYKSGKHRLDWILVSKDLEFVSYEVPQVVLSDHMPVKAVLKLTGHPVDNITNSSANPSSGVSHD